MILILLLLLMLLLPFVFLCQVTVIQEANTFVVILRFRIDTPLLATEVDQVEVV